VLDAVDSTAGGVRVGDYRRHREDVQPIKVLGARRVPLLHRVAPDLSRRHRNPARTLSCTTRCGPGRCRAPRDVPTLPVGAEGERRPAEALEDITRVAQARPLDHAGPLLAAARSRSAAWTGFPAPTRTTSMGNADDSGWPLGPPGTRFYLSNGEGRAERAPDER
jgi:hypothetical protein